MRLSITWYHISGNWIFLMKFNLILLFIIGNIFASTPDPVSVHPGGQVGLYDCVSAKTLGFTRLQFSLLGDFAYDQNLVPRLIRHEGLFSYDTLKPFAVLYGIHPAIAFGVTDFLDLSVWQPFYMDVLEGLPPSGGFGDLRVSLKCRIPGRASRPVDGALFSSLSLGTGHQTSGYFPRHGYYLRRQDFESPSVDPVALLSAGKPVWSISALGTFTLKRLLLHVNLGTLIPADARLDKAITGAVGFEVHPTDGFAFFADAYAEPRLENLLDGFKLGNDGFHVAPGITFHTPGGAELTIGGTWKLSSNRILTIRDTLRVLELSTRMEPQWRIFVRLGWGGFLVARDKDGDGVLDKDDRCTDQKEDLDGFQDQDGCPDTDNDGDKILDDADSCLNVMEDMDGVRDDDGCPDFDNDADGIPDSVDNCASAAEDRDGFEDTDGCPDFDNDKDGVPDSLDKCIGIPEDPDGFELDGCPDYDNDMDGVPDSSDMCPDSAGSPEEKGCPRQREKSKEIPFGRLILPDVQFGGGSAELTTGAAAGIDRVYQSLVDWPEVRLEIQAHTDNSASPEASLMLSQRRADAVRNYLVQKGIDITRLSATGKGSDEPIADNKTIQGRKLNVRIEIHRLN
jgi:outer membrane protein OmpA-like peptidoglycan-associated protein